MNREDLLERITKEAEKLDRDDLTTHERRRYQERYNELEAQLHVVDEREKYPERVKVQIEKIRSILGTDKPRKSG